MVKTGFIFSVMMLAAVAGAEEMIGDPFTADICPVSGKKLGSMGDPISFIVEGGREVKVCCAGCEAPVKADPAGTLAKIDKQMIAKQKEFYPMDTCIISGKKLGSMGDPISFIVNNRHVQVCCAGCEAPAKADAAATIAKLDKAVIAKQSKDYPFDKCPISGHALEDGKAINIVVGNQLIKACCGGCEDPIKANAAKYTAMVLSKKFVADEGSDEK
jgi:hypothetical protein